MLVSDERCTCTFKDKAHCFCACVKLTCIMRLFLQDTNHNPLVTNMKMVYASLKSNARQWDWAVTCMFHGIFNYWTLPSVFTEEIMYFSKIFHFFWKNESLLPIMLLNMWSNKDVWFLRNMVTRSLLKFPFRCIGWFPL